MLTAHWYLPTGGDYRSFNDFGRTYTDGIQPGCSYRPATWDYLSVIARTVDSLGYGAMLTPTGFNCEDAWITTSALLPETRDLKFMVAFRPSLVNPVLAAQMVTSYQRMSGGRLLLNVVPGATGPEAERYADWLDKEERMAQAGEFMEVMYGAWSDEPFDYDGRFYRARGTMIPPPDPRPRIYFGGSSVPSGEFSAKYADCYLTWGEPLELIDEKLTWMRGLAAKHERTLDFGMRIQVLTRDTADEAWAHANRMLAEVPEEKIRRNQETLAKRGSVGTQRLVALTGGKRENILLGPNLWAGSSLVRGGIGVTLVGSHAEVADRLEEFHALGITELVLSGYPHWEEARYFAEGVMPLLRAKGLMAQPARGPLLAG